MLASARGHDRIVRELLAHKDIELNQTNYDGDTALLLALKKGHDNIAYKFLLHKDIDVNKRNKLDETALILATKKQYLEIVRKLISKEDIEVNQKDYEKRTALSYVIDHASDDIARELLKHEGLDVFIKFKLPYGTKFKSSVDFAEFQQNRLAPIMRAGERVGTYSRGAGFVDGFADFRWPAARCQPNVWSKRLSRTSKKHYYWNAETKTSQWEKPTMWRECWTSQWEKPICETLKLCYWNEETRTIQWEQPEQFLGVEDWPIGDSFLEVMHNFTRKHPPTTLIDAARYGFPDVVRSLLELEFTEVNLCDEDGYTALHWAAEKNFTAIVRMLLMRKDMEVNKGSVPNSGLYSRVTDVAEHNIGPSALHIGCMQKHLYVVRELLKHDEIDVYACNDEGCDDEGLIAIDLAPPHIAELLKEFMTARPPKTLIDAARAGFVDAVRELLTCESADVYVTDRWGNTAYDLAKKKKHHVIVELLEEFMIAHPPTTLLDAAKYDFVDIVREFLTQEGVDVNQRDKNSFTPLILAVQRGHENIVRELLKHESIDIYARPVLEPNGFRGLAPIEIVADNSYCKTLVPRNAPRILEILKEFEAAHPVTIKNKFNAHIVENAEQAKRECVNFLGREPEDDFRHMAVHARKQLLASIKK